TYNADGTPASHTDFNGATRTFEYDRNQRLTRRAYPDGSQVTFKYTSSGQRESATDARGITAYSYDLRDRLLEKVDPNGYKLSYEYDLQGNRTSLAATVGAEVYTTTYGYDPLNRLETVTDFQGQVYNLAYDENGNRASLVFPNSVTTTYTYDPLNRLTNLSSSTGVGEVLQSYQYRLEAAGNRTRIDEHDGRAHHYSYDDLYRLTQDKVTDPADALVYQRNFSYDPAGNRLEQVVDEADGPTTSASTYDDRDRLLTTDATPYGWDTNGNLISHDGSSYGWDSENRLRSVTLADGTLVETAYDADGNRVSTAVMPPGGPATAVDYLVDTAGFLSHVVADVVGESVQALYTRADDQLIGLHRPALGTSKYYHSDGLGSVRVLSDNAGVVTDRYSFTAFGSLLEHSGSDFQPYRFAGEPFDPSIGFYYNRARWLDVAGGRFLTFDPFPSIDFEPSTLHRYTYTSLNPVNFVDPSGLFFSSGSNEFSMVAVIHELVAAINVVAFAVNTVKATGFGL
ncbi:MAG: RHS repeat-associated core domain-containing protein, partial [bacterium]|nr:RHS repeat-associated core domain-containing protein [bacterium]